MHIILGSVITIAAIVSANAAYAVDKKCSIAAMLELPVTMINRQPTVPVELDGHKMRLVIDSGAFFSSLSPGTANEFGFKLRSAPHGLILSGVGGGVNPSVTRIATFKLGGATLHSVDFLVGGSEAGAAGLLGQNVLAVGDVEYDLPDGIVRMFKPSNCNHTSLAYWAQADQFSVEVISPPRLAMFHTKGAVELNGVKLTAIFDTGAGTSILSRGAAARAGVHPGDSGVLEAGFAHGIGRRRVKTWIAPFKSLAIGDNETIKNIRLRFGEFGDSDKFDMLIGADFFLSHRVYVSNGQHRMYFSYVGGPVFDLITHRDDGVPPATLSSAVALSGRGMASAARHDFAQAKDDLDHAIALDSGNGQYYFERSKIEFELRDQKAAAADLDAAIKHMPRKAQYRLARGWRKVNDDKTGALSDANAADRLMAEPSDGRIELAHLYQELDRPRQAIIQFDRWIKAHPHDAKLGGALNGRCWVRATQGKDFAGALDDCKHALKLHRHDPNILVSRGFAYLRLGAFDKAIADYDAALKLNPKSATSLYGRGVAWRHLGRAAKANADIAAAQALDADEVRKLESFGIGR